MRILKLRRMSKNCIQTGKSGRCRSFMAPTAVAAAPPPPSHERCRNVAGASCGNGSSRNSVRDCSTRDSAQQESQEMPSQHNSAPCCGPCRPHTVGAYWGDVGGVRWGGGGVGLRCGGVSGELGWDRGIKTRPGKHRCTRRDEASWEGAESAVAMASTKASSGCAPIQSPQRGQQSEKMRLAGSRTIEIRRPACEHYHSLFLSLRL